MGTAISRELNKGAIPSTPVDTTEMDRARMAAMLNEDFRPIEEYHQRMAMRTMSGNSPKNALESENLVAWALTLAAHARIGKRLMEGK